MESLPRLRSNLLTTLDPQNNIDEQELFDLLVLHRRNLINLFDVNPPSEQERRELQSGTLPILFGSTRLIPFTSGKCTVDGRQMSVNNDFATQVIYLARVPVLFRALYRWAHATCHLSQPEPQPREYLGGSSVRVSPKATRFRGLYPLLLEVAELVGSPELYCSPRSPRTLCEATTYPIKGGC
jgi:hypothetical protein